MMFLGRSILTVSHRFACAKNSLFSEIIISCHVFRRNRHTLWQSYLCVCFCQYCVVLCQIHGSKYFFLMHDYLGPEV